MLILGGGTAGTIMANKLHKALNGEGWEITVVFSAMKGALALQRFLKSWEGGKLVVAITELSFKCPVDPLEFTFLAEAFFSEKGIRDKVDITLVTPMSGAFTKPIATKMLSGLMEEKNINLVTDFYIEKVDNEKQVLSSYDEQEIPFDLLTIVPMNMGNELIERSGLGDDMNHVPTDKHTLQSKAYKNIFVLGDAADLPTSKAGSVAHFAADILFENLTSLIEGRPMTASFDGHANCYIETGYGKGALIDFNYETEPLPVTYPLPGIGPFGLLKNIGNFNRTMTLLTSMTEKEDIPEYSLWKVVREMNRIHTGTVGNPAMGMPGGLPFPSLLGMLPGVEAGVSAMMKNQMEELDIPPVDEFMEMITAGGGEIYACKLAMDMFKLK